MSGYVRTFIASALGVERRVQEISRYCAANGYRLGSVFVDDGVAGDSADRAGFTALVDAVAASGRCQVVLTDARQLSWNLGEAQRLAERLRATGAEIVLVDRPDEVRSTAAVLARLLVCGEEDEHDGTAA